MEHFWW